MEPHWDSGPDPGVPEAGDTGAVTVGPQIPHPVAPALVSQAGGEGAPGARQGWVFSWGREGEAGNMFLVGKDFLQYPQPGTVLDTDRLILKHKTPSGTGE